jgi:hypothetical protein
LKRAASSSCPLFRRRPASGSRLAGGAAERTQPLQEARGFNQGANSVQTNPNKTKQKSLDFLGFIRPNRDFSKGYERKSKKNSTRVSGCVQNVSNALFTSFIGGHVWQGRVQNLAIEKA